MRSFYSMCLVAVCAWSSIFSVVSAAGYEDYRKKQMVQDLEVIKHHFEAGYAPLEWKKEYANFDLEKAFEEAKQQILTAQGINTKQFQRIVRNFVQQMGDYHVDILFFSTEAASLPFSVKRADGRFFVDWIDVIKLPPSHYPIRVGDELLQFGDRPMSEVMAELEQQGGRRANPLTDQRMADLKLTRRAGMVGDIVPKGSIIISTRSASSGKVNTYQLHWSFTPENVANPLDLLDSLDFLPGLIPEKKKETKLAIPKLMMASPLHEAYVAGEMAGWLGARKSFLPRFGEVVWINGKPAEKEKKTEGDDVPVAQVEEPKEEKIFGKWNAYIYRHPNGQDIGVVRIPHYMESHEIANEFGELINFFEEKTDALVIDQLHNVGGLVSYMYELASILATEPLKAPYHRIKISQKEAMMAYANLEMIKLLDLVMTAMEDDDESEGDEAEEEESDDSEEGEKKINYQEMMFLKAFCELILDDWDHGKTLTRPTPILGIDRINPHPKYRYTKPILMLIDEMDFSGGDFMPAIMQDNGRAVLFGARTAGAGGYVTAFQFPNSNGIAICGCTASIAERSDQKKIENLGVKPDIEYQLTADDIHKGYEGYRNAVNQAVQQLLEKK